MSESTQTEVFVREDGKNHSIRIHSELDEKLQEELKRRWEASLTILVPLLGVVSSLVIQIKPNEIVVFSVSGNPDNPIKLGEHCPLGKGYYCETTVGKDAPFCINDSAKDPLWHDNPDAQNGLTAYLGEPLHYPDGSFFGTLCLLNNRPLADSEQAKKVLGQVALAFQRDLEFLAIVQEKENEAQEAQALKEKAEAKEKEALVALKKAQEAESNKTAFLSNISHDMRTPLNAIIGYANLAQKATDRRSMVTYLERIKEGSSLLLSLVNDTLDVMKIDSGAIVLRQEGMKLSSVFDAAYLTLSPAIENKHLLFVKEVEPGANVEVKGDPIRLQEVFMNLLSNAVKFTGENGQVTFAIQVGEESAGEIHYAISVRDTGCGMSAEFMKQIFTPFATERNEANSTVEGSGLGLAIVKRLVDTMGGTIKVKTELGKGSRFDIRLSFPKAGASSSQVKSEKKVDLKSLKDKRVLICEDNAMNLQIMSLLLQSQGMKVVTAVNGKLASDAFLSSESHYFNAILMDIRMPIMDGYEATRVIRSSSHPDAKVVPIIAMTADAFDSDIAKCLEAGMDDHLAKPVEPDRLFETLSYYFKR